MSPSTSSPIVVLVHGAFADASSWNGVIGELRKADIDVCAPANPLRGVGSDAAYLTGFVDSLDRPVVLVGHSYAGAVITQSGADAKNAVGLVFVAAFAPEANETLTDINSRYPDVPLGAVLLPFTYAKDGGGQGTDLWIDPAKFHDAFCADVPADQARLMSETQRSAAADAFTTAVTGTPAWKTRPSWVIVAASDRAIHPDAEREMAKRAGSETVEIDGSHAVAVSQPKPVAEVIARAVAATS